MIFHSNKDPRFLDALARIFAASASIVINTDRSRPLLGPPPHSHRIKNKLRAMRVRGGR